MKTKNCFFILPLIFSGLSVTAQKNYQPGWVLPEQGDTLKGLVDYRNWERNPKDISFKINSTSDATSYSVRDLKAFAVTGMDLYVKAAVVKDMLPVNLNALDVEGSEHMVADTVFLRSIVQGDKISLYELVDLKPHYFIQQSNNTFEELLFKRYIQSDQTTSTITRNIFRDQLKRFALGNEALRNKIDRASYNEDELTPLVRSLNGYVSEMQPSTTQNQKKHRFFVGAGMSYNKISFGGLQPDLTVLDSKASLSPSLEVGAQLFTKRDFQNLFFRFQVRYNSINYHGEGIGDGPLTYQKQKKEYDLKMNMVSPAFYILYGVLRIGTGKLFLGLGAGYNLTSYTENKFTKTDVDTGVSSQEDHYLDLGSWADIHGKLGYIFLDRFEVDIDTRVSGTFTNFNGISSKARSTTLSAKIHF